ncbi:MAG: apolipoprotein N-acyltransferase [Actinomycetota bacterium]|nr:apolipoprotein N-acyltransferase [Actinomycetota bacterium]
MRLAAGAAAGGLIAVSIPPYGWWPLAVVGYGVVALSLTGASLGGRLTLGAGVGLAQYGIGVWWVNEFSVPGCIVLILLGGLWVAAALGLVPGRGRLGVTVGLPAVMVLSDWGRSRYPLGGFPLGGTSLGQASSPWAPVLRLGGSLALTLLTAIAGLVLAALVEAAWRGRRRQQSVGVGAGWGSPVRAGLGMAAVLVVVVAAADWSPHGGGAPAQGLRSLKVALVQGGGPRGTRAINTDPQLVFDRQLQASAGLRAPVDLVVWPEATLQSFSHPVASTAEGSAVAGLAISLSATLVVGVEHDVGTEHYYNAALAWAPDGTIVGQYIKNHRVPFGEYVPGRRLLSHFFNLADVPLDAVAGHGPGILHSPAGPLGVMISYEVFFDDRARGAVDAGGEILVVPTNTASYRSDQVPAQELAAARLRAIETGRALLQVTPTGYTAVVGPDGHVEQQTALGRRQVLTAAVPLRTGRTVYVRYGDLPTLIVALLGLTGGWVFALARRAGAASSEGHGA